MTDFLSRVAARAVGATAAARPRLAGLFEPAGSAADATLELVEEEVVAPAPAPRGTAAPGATERGRHAAPHVDAPPVEVAQAAGSTAVPAARRPAPLPDLISQSNYVPAPQPAIRARVPEPEPVPAAHPGEGVAPPVAAATLAHALPVAAVVREAPPPAAAPPPQVKEPPVRVHIGRLEVRANVQPPPTERPSREAPRSAELSLTDYLRGKREARA